VVKRLKPLPIEAVARGYLIGSGWKDYQSSGGVCGIPLPAGLQMAQQLPEPIFTPSTKAERAIMTKTSASPTSRS
jgi:phosphoribosylaminoimidazole-succinocarboxamide synthase